MGWCRLGQEGEEAVSGGIARRIEEAVETLLELAGPRERRPGVVRLERVGEYAELILDNPGSRNAMTLHMMVDLGRCVQRLLEFELGVVVMRSSTPGIFCAGGHLADVRSSLALPESGQRMCEAMSAILNELLDAPYLVVAVLDGPAIGGGAEIAVAADLRLMTAAGYLHFVHAELGVVPGWGGAARLIAHCGVGHALRLLTTRERCRGDLAETMGLGIALAEDDLQLRIENLAGLTPAVLRALKAQVLCGRRLGDAAREKLEARHFAEVWAGEAHAAALAKLNL
jgi:enoyl-CoA hydratase/carnithine racemase